MTYLLDTNACIGILNGTVPALVDSLRKHKPSAIRICSVVRAELLYRARKSRRVAENLNLLEVFFSPFVSLPFDDRCAEHYGAIRAELEKESRVIGPNDLMIAATARANDVTLVSENVREFSRVVGLRLENWNP